MKITLYTITTCQFSKQEREYLAVHGLQYEEKNLEMNREFLSEMLTVGNNFAGTPVTKIEKDDGQIVVLKGFTIEEFDKTLGFTTEQPKQEAANTAPTSEAVVPVASTESAQQPADKPQVTAPVAPAQQPPTPPEQPVAQAAAPQAPAPQAPTDPAMASILTNLEQKASSPASPAQPAIPDPKF